jgi:hypothetical protein
MGEQKFHVNNTIDFKYPISPFQDQIVENGDETFIKIPKFVLLKLWTSLDVYPSIECSWMWIVAIHVHRLHLFSHECFLSLD